MVIFNIFYLAACDKTKAFIIQSTGGGSGCLDSLTVFVFQLFYV